MSGLTHTNTRLPLWLRLVAYAYSQQHQGEVRLLAGELREALNVDSAAEVSRAIDTAKRYHVLTPDSSARCLYIQSTRIKVK